PIWVSYYFSRRLLMNLLLVTGLETIRPDQPTMSTNEKHSTTLSCTYDGSPFSLLWYRQKPGSRPEFLLRARSRSAYGSSPPARFQSTTSRTSTELSITNATLTDSALYYCALRVVVDKHKGHVDLLISSAVLSDSVLYYCARTTVL
uniref:Ig-like domain-containing protein n=1 Tax=Electrophorus electricus TaxID=8005 RepID=A0AAY5F342_ELEEL